VLLLVPVPLLVLPVVDPEPLDPEPLEVALVVPPPSSPVPVAGDCEPWEPHMTSPTGNRRRSGSVRRGFETAIFRSSGLESADCNARARSTHG
jgi:hypothetical protein